MQCLSDLALGLKNLPSLGGKSAKKIALHLALNKKKCADLIKVMQSVLDNTASCVRCHNICLKSVEDEVELCHVCTNVSRDMQKIVIVEAIEDLEIIESCGDYKGLYHIIGGAISFSEKILPQSLNIASLIERLKNTDGTSKIELIFANSTTINGKITMSYIQNLIISEGLGERLIQSEISVGVPLGSSLNFLDSATMSLALKNRRLSGGL